MPRWGGFEATFTSSRTFENPLQELDLHVTFTGPSGQPQTVGGFWDGGTTWRVRFSPGEAGVWTYTTRTVPDSAEGLHGQKGAFNVVPSEGSTRFARHGPVGVARTRTFLAHADGTPFFWLADTGWNAALHSTPEEWQHYVEQRARQRFTAIQGVATQWRAAPEGDRLGESVFTGHERIAVNPAFSSASTQKPRP